MTDPVNNKCLRYLCKEPRCEDSVCCELHTIEVLLGLRKAPPLRRNIDYISVGRKTFLVDYGYNESNPSEEIAEGEKWSEAVAELRRKLEK